MKSFYNLNGLLTLSIEGPAQAIKSLNDRELGYFKLDHPLNETDIEVIMGLVPFISPPYRVVSGKYYVNEHAIYAKDSHKVANWEVMIEGLNQQKTTLYYKGNYFSRQFTLWGFLIEPIIRYKLNRNGYFMVHSSAISTSVGTIVFPASSGVGKTSTMLNWLHAGADFVSDDFTIISSKGVYSYPTPISLRSYTLSVMPFLKENLQRREIFWVNMNSLISKMTLGYGSISHKLDVQTIFPKANIVNNSSLKGVVIFTKGSGEDVQVFKISKEELLDRLILINRFETPRFVDYLQAYDYANKTKSKDVFWEKMRSNGNDIFTDTTYYEFLIPSQYTPKTFEQINSQLKVIYGIED